MNPFLAIALVLLAVSIVAFFGGLVGFFIKLAKTIYSRFFLKERLSLPPSPITYKVAGLNLWWHWVVVTTLGGSGGFLVSYLMAFISSFDPFQGSIGASVLGGIFGVFIGVLQYHALRYYFPQANKWIWACALTWAIQVGSSMLLAEIFFPMSTPARILLVLPLVGALAGFPQWFILKSLSRRANWWILFNALIWTISLPVTLWISFPLLEKEGDVIPFVISPWAIGSALGFINGVLTATAVVWVSKQPFQKPVVLGPEAG